VRLPAVRAAAAPALPPPVWNNPWEHRGGRGPLAAFAETLQRSLFHPAEFFRGTAPDGGARAALLYAVIVGTLSSLVAALWVRVMGRHVQWELSGNLMPLLEDRVIGLGFLVMVPLEIALWCLLLAGLHHATLAVLGGARGTYQTTLKAVCYSLSAISFIVFPVCGLPLAIVWMVCTLIIGMRELHKTSTARAFWAWLLPYVLFFCLVGAAVSSMMFMLGKVWQQFFGGRFEV
jgi:hypothetical protein